MLYIGEDKINLENSQIRFYLTYPILQSNFNIIPKINKFIYEDVINFKELVNEILTRPIIKGFNYKINAISEYRVSYNKNKIISISIEFSQLIGLYDITYINSYNYDIDMEKEIKLKDLFKVNIDYIDIINYFILKNMDESLYQEFRGINDENTFYFTNENLVICFSSYEIHQSYSIALEYKILFKDLLGYLSDYTINNIMGE